MGRDERETERVFGGIRGEAVSGTEQKKGLGPEMRILVASLLSMLVIIAWAKFFAPKPAPQTQALQDT